MPQPVFNMFDKGLWLSCLSQDDVCNFNISPLVSAADIIDLTLDSFMQHYVNSLTIIFHVYPVTHVHTISIKWKLLVLKCISNKQRDQLFRILVRTEVVGASCDNHRQMICRRGGVHTHV